MMFHRAGWIWHPILAMVVGAMLLWVVGRGVVKCPIAGMILWLAIYGELVVTGFRLHPTFRSEWFLAETRVDRRLKADGGSSGPWPGMISLPMSVVPGDRVARMGAGETLELAIRDLRSRQPPNLSVLSGSRVINAQNPLVPASMVQPLKWLAGQPAFDSYAARDLLDDLGVHWILSQDPLLGLGRPLRAGRMLLYSRATARPAVGLLRADNHAPAVRSHADGWTVKTSLSRANNLLFRTSCRSGWRVTDEGEARLHVSAAAPLWGGVPIRSGDHTYEIRYEPFWPKLGFLLSSVVLTWLLSLATLYGPLRRHDDVG